MGRLLDIRLASLDRMMIYASHNPRQNHLLAALPHDQWERWRSHFEYVDMPLETSALRARKQADPRLLSYHGDRVTSVCDEELRIG